MRDNKVYFVEDYHEIPGRIRDLIARGWAVYNAPRPLFGHERWEGKFRRGIFYAAVAPDGDPVDEFNDAPTFHRRNRELDAGECIIISRETVMAHGAKLSDEFDLDLSSFDYPDIVDSLLNWMEHHKEAA